MNRLSEAVKRLKEELEDILDDDADMLVRGLVLLGRPQAHTLKLTHTGVSTHLTATFMQPCILHKH